MKKVTYETEEGDRLFAIACQAMEELDMVQKDQDRLHYDMEATSEGLVTASKEFTKMLGPAQCSVSQRQTYTRKIERRLQGSQ